VAGLAGFLGMKPSSDRSVIHATRSHPSSPGKAKLHRHEDVLRHTETSGDRVRYGGGTAAGPTPNPRDLLGTRPEGDRRCGHKWSYGPFIDPQVYYIDFSGDSWPVHDAQIDWYQAPGIDAYYRWHTAGCPGGGRHCVNVREGRYGTACYGYTEATVSGGYFVGTPDGQTQQPGDAEHLRGTAERRLPRDGTRTGDGAQQQHQQLHVRAAIPAAPVVTGLLRTQPVLPQARHLIRHQHREARPVRASRLPDRP
jgi:hypothetical protein